MNLDQYDIALLSFLQSHGRATHHQIAEHVSLSPSQIGRRLQRLESIGVIAGYRVVLREDRIGLNVMAFTGLKLKHHGDSIIERFQREIAVLPEVLECHAVVGDTDYMLRIVAGSLQDLSEFVMKKLMRVPGVDSIQSNIVLTTFKRDGAMPLDRAPTRVN
ncbi:Lrp/AsnC family transcriptional regulator [Chitinasiproducens palmae]|uniref:DNA-binding transcriptional regulator, Lrp family n=1 Tax=Chitinasiproducens palmae TaxID=1770053 RepID=A0A1H2PP53_9BURK|nr:DNA-binding transcriptional regulator, Lrp family [Chitinasiproducens palmae]